MEVGSYDDFHAVRTRIASLEDAWGERFPVLMNHSDSDGEWSSVECAELLDELRVIRDELSTQPPRDYPEGSWQSGVLRHLGAAPSDAATSLIDVDGGPLLQRLEDLASLAVTQARPISFM